jgi:hypothetical protein
MPEPIASSPEQYYCYDDNYVPESSSAGSCDPSVMSCAADGASEEVPAEPAPATSGTSHLVNRVATRVGQEGDCNRYLKESVLMCGTAASSAAGAIATAPTGFGLVAFTVTFGTSLYKCGDSIDKYNACSDTQERREQVISDCETQGGTALQGADSSVIICETSP